MGCSQNFKAIEWTQCILCIAGLKNILEKDVALENVERQNGHVLKYLENLCLIEKMIMRYPKNFKKS